MRLGYHYHIPAISNNGAIKTFAQQGLFLDSLAIYFDKIFCFLYSPRESEIPLIDYEIKNKNIILIDIGTNKPVYHRSIFFNNKLKQIYKNDIVFVRGPTPTLPSIILKAANVSTAVLLVGDYRLGVDEIPQSNWRRSLIKAWTVFYQAKQKKALSRSLVLVNNKLLYNESKQITTNTKLVFTSTLFKSVFFKRDDTCLNEAITILYVGRFDKQKGLEDIAVAILDLLDKGYNLNFSIVGFGDSRDQVANNISTLFKENDKLNCFINHGFIPLGKELFKLYRESDMFITASRATEGFPRTIWEALSQSLPVITTPVGGIPFHVKDKKHVLYCKSNDSQSISSAIEEIINDASLRRRLIKNGHKIAESKTIEKSAERIFYELQNNFKK
jgi:glycosyltransferase involved in cell wall biosynthesis